MEALAGVTRTSSLLLGICIPSIKHNASKFKIQQLDFDTKILAYFKQSFILYAYDPQKICKSGDVVLIEKLKNRLSKTIEHKVLKVIYPCGDITDPITGKKVVGHSYRDEEEFKDSVFGKSDLAFDYKTAPERGTQENKRDFSHRELFKKYHDFEEGDENKDHPHERLY